MEIEKYLEQNINEYEKYLEQNIKGESNDFRVYGKDYHCLKKKKGYLIKRYRTPLRRGDVSKIK